MVRVLAMSAQPSSRCSTRSGAAAVAASAAAASTRARGRAAALGPAAAAVGLRTARPRVVAQPAGEGIGQRPADRLGRSQRQRHLGGAATAGGHRRLGRLGAADRDDAGSADLPPGHGLEREAAIGVDAGEERRVRRAGGEVDLADPRLPRQRRAEVLVRHEPVGDEDAAEPLVLPGLLGQRLARARPARARLPAPAARRARPSRPSPRGPASGPRLERTAGSRPSGTPHTGTRLLLSRT